MAKIKTLVPDYRSLIFTFWFLLIILVCMLLHWHNRLFAHPEPPSLAVVDMPVVITQLMAKQGVPDKEFMAEAQLFTQRLSAVTEQVSKQYNVVLLSSSTVITSLPDFTQIVLQELENEPVKQ